MISGIGTTAAPAGATAAQGSGLGALDSEAFLKLLVAQLRYQNPLQPTDASSMLQQTAAFSQVETLQQLAQSQRTLLGMNEALMAAGLVGRTVTAVRPDETVLRGTVSGVRFTAAGPALDVAGEEVALAAVTQIGDVSDGSATA